MSDPQPEIATAARATTRAVSGRARSEPTKPRHLAEHVARNQARLVDVDLMSAAGRDHLLRLRVQRGEISLAALPGPIDDAREAPRHPRGDAEAVVRGDHGRSHS